MTQATFVPNRSDSLPIDWDSKTPSAFAPNHVDGEKADFRSRVVPERPGVISELYAQGTPDLGTLWVTN